MCYQARSLVEAGKSGSQLYVFHVPWIDYDEEKCVWVGAGACVRSFVKDNHLDLTRSQVRVAFFFQKITSLITLHDSISGSFLNLGF